MKKTFIYHTTIGPLSITDSDGAITAISCGGTIPAGHANQETPVTKKAAVQLAEYLAGERKGFDLPIRSEGTEFEQRVWQALRNIPYGETRSYAQIAAAVGSPKACRAVGRANGRNPHLIVTPCHRVIGSNGSLTGFAAGTDIKRTLLDLETNTLWK